MLALIAAIHWAKQPLFSPEQMPTAGIKSWDPNAALPDSDLNLLTVVTYNIGYASGEKNNTAEALSEDEVRVHLQEMLDRLRPLEIDILCLQEVDFWADRSHRVNQMEALAQGLGFPYAAHVINWNKRYLPWPYWPPSAHYGGLVSGQVILSRYPIKQHRTTFFDKPTPNAFWYNWFYIDRVAQRVVIEISNRELEVWNIHLEAHHPETRLEQIRYLAKLVQASSHPLRIVAGDFNTWPSAPEGGYEIFHEQTKLSPDAAPGFSIPSWGPKRKLDHLFYSADLKREAQGIVTGLTASDHLPVWIRLTIPAE